MGVKGRAFTFTCSANGHPQPSYIWQLPNGQPHVGNFLTLQNVQFANGGMYTCFARVIILNAGIKTVSVRVKFRIEGKLCCVESCKYSCLFYVGTVGPPQKCNQLWATSYKATSIAVNVICPVDGNSSITEFEVQYHKTAGKWVSVKFDASVSQPFIVRDLIPSTWYEVRVRAANKYSYEKGNVSFSDPVRVRTADGICN